ncbi:MAG: tRNA lysidine(34) synthetase TilS [Bacteroidales bacterium]
MQTKFDNSLLELSNGEIKNKKYLVTVSGGVDSMCMANLFYDSPLKPEFAIAHVNFTLRKGDCDLDQQFVKDWANERGIKFHTITVDTHKYARENSISTQMSARDLRYNWFYELIDKYSYDFLAVAHNLNDSVETLFLNLLRGTGVKGLLGIRAVNDKIIRPLISVTRSEINEYMNKQGNSHRDDKTNFESHYSRNRLRNVIFPEFSKINPSFINSVFRSSNYFTQAFDVLEDVYESHKGSLYTEENGEFLIDIDKLLAEKHPEYWIYRLINEKGFNASQISQVMTSIKSKGKGQTGKVFRSQTHELLIDRGNIRIYLIPDTSVKELIITEPGIYTFEGITFKFDLFVKPYHFNPSAVHEGQLFLDGELLKMPLTVRSWQAADKFKPLGMKKGFKKISDFYTDLKLSKRAKDMQPIIFSGSEISCVLGLRIDDRYKIKTSTKIIAEVEIVL